MVLMGFDTHHILCYNYKAAEDMSFGVSHLTHRPLLIGQKKNSPAGTWMN